MTSALFWLITVFLICATAVIIAGMLVGGVVFYEDVSDYIRARAKLMQAKAEKLRGEE